MHQGPVSLHQLGPHFVAKKGSTDQLEAGPPSSILFAERRSFKDKTSTPQHMPIWKRALESSQSLSVRNFYRQRSNRIIAHLLMRRLELDLGEEGTRISLTIVDTPGFGDQIDNEARQVYLG